MGAGLAAVLGHRPQVAAHQLLAAIQGSSHLPKACMSNADLSFILQPSQMQKSCLLGTAQEAPNLT
jgi:hypothetical protein